MQLQLSLTFCMICKDCCWWATGSKHAILGPAWMSLSCIGNVICSQINIVKIYLVISQFGNSLRSNFLGPMLQTAKWSNISIDKWNLFPIPHYWNMLSMSFLSLIHLFFSLRLRLFVRSCWYRSVICSGWRTVTCSASVLFRVRHKYTATHIQMG